MKLGLGTDALIPEWRQEILQENEVPTTSSVPGSEVGESTEGAETMMDATGQLDVDEDGKWDYYGHGSGVAFFQRMEEVFGRQIGADLRKNRLISRIPIPLLFETRPATSIRTSHGDLLPLRRIVDELVSTALDHACALDSFVHRPTFDRLLKRVYAISPPKFGSEERDFIPLLYSILALGCLFTPRTLEHMGYDCATLEGYATTPEME